MERGHRYKRSPQNSSADLLEIRTTLKYLDARKLELDKNSGTEEEVRRISHRVCALEEVLQSVMKHRVTFSLVREDDLERAGVVRKLLDFDSVKTSEAQQRFSPAANAEIVDLHSRIKKIYDRVSLNQPEGSRMILDAVLFSLADIAFAEQRAVAIIPNLKIASIEKVKVTRPDTGFELWLRGTLDYAIIEYDDIMNRKNRFLSALGARDSIDLSKGRLLLVEAKRQGPYLEVANHLSKAISQAIALLQASKDPEVRFCLSDGQYWIFYVLKSEEGTLTYYESAEYHLSKEALQISDGPLREILVFLSEWLRPTITDLYEVE